MPYHPNYVTFVKRSNGWIQIRVGGSVAVTYSPREWREIIEEMAHDEERTGLAPT